MPGAQRLEKNLFLTATANLGSFGLIPLSFVSTWFFRCSSLPPFLQGNPHSTELCTAHQGMECQSEIALYMAGRLAFLLQALFWARLLFLSCLASGLPDFDLRCGWQTGSSCLDQKTTNAWGQKATFRYSSFQQSAEPIS